MDRVRRGEHDLSGIPEPLRHLLAEALDPEPHQRPTVAEILGSPLLPIPGPPQRRRRRADDDADGGRLRNGRGDHDVLDPDDAAPQTRHSPRSRRSWSVSDPGRRSTPGPTSPRRTGRCLRFERRPVARAAAPRCPSVGGGAGLRGAGRGVPLVRLARARPGHVVAPERVLGGECGGRAAPDAWAKWYDGAQFLLRTPYDLVRAIPGTLMLVLWSGGLAVAAALLCYAFTAGEGSTLGVCGTTFANRRVDGPGRRACALAALTGGQPVVGHLEAVGRRARLTIVAATRPWGCSPSSAAPSGLRAGSAVVG